MLPNMVPTPEHVHTLGLHHHVETIHLLPELLVLRIHIRGDGTHLPQNLRPAQTSHQDDDGANNALQDILRPQVSISHGCHSIAAEIEGCNVNSQRVLSCDNAKSNVRSLDVVDPLWNAIINQMEAHCPKAR